MVRLTNEQAIGMMEAKLECMERDVSGRVQDCNNKLCGECRLNYEQGNMGEQKEWLRIGIKALKNQKNLIEELEKIKSELHKLAFDEDDGDYMGMMDDDEVMNCIDIHISELNHISELKGE